MPNTRYNQRKAYLAVVFEQQKRRAIDAGIEPFHGLQCEVAFRRSIKQPLDEWMKKECKGQLCLDHIDNDNDNNDPSNHQCLCKGHNGTKNGRHSRDTTPKFLRSNDILQSLRERARGRRNTLKSLQDWTNGGEPTVVRYHEMAKNLVCEPLAFKLFEKIMRLHPEIRHKDMVDSLARGADCSQQTASRYVDKWCAPIVEKAGKLVAGEYEVKSANGERVIRRRGSSDDAGNVPLGPAMLG